MKSFFDIIAPLYEKTHFGARKTFDTIESLAHFKPSDTVLDLGGGTGRIAQFLIHKVSSVIVIDASEKMIEQCKKIHPELHCMHADAENVPLADNSVDKIILVHSFHHFQNQKLVIKEMKRMLANNGEIIMEEFNPQKIGGMFVAFIEDMLRMKSTFYHPQSLAALFSSNGFEVQIFNAERRVYYLMGKKVS